jgi:hypothetical protein
MEPIAATNAYCPLCFKPFDDEDHTLPCWTCPSCHHQICDECFDHWFDGEDESDEDKPEYMRHGQHSYSICPFCRENVDDGLGDRITYIDSDGDESDIDLSFANPYDEDDIVF